MDDIAKLKLLIKKWRVRAGECLELSKEHTDPSEVGRMIAERKTFIQCASNLEEISNSLSILNYLTIEDADRLINDMKLRTRRACAQAVLVIDKSGTAEEIINRAHEACMAVEVIWPPDLELKCHPNIADFWEKVF